MYRTDIFQYLASAAHGSRAALSSFSSALPHGGIESTCLLQSLHDALALQGPLLGIFAIAEKVPEHRWLIGYPISTMPSRYKGIQTAVLKILSIDESCAVLSNSLYDKCLVTFPSDIFGNICKQVDWFPKLEELFKSTNSFLRMCWLKAISGAWTTTCRMPSPEK